MQGFIGEVGNATVYLGALVVVWFTYWVIASTVRRLLGVSVGWVRSILVAVGMVSAMSAVVPWIARSTGLEGNSYNVSEGGPFLLVLLLTALWSFALGALILVALEIIIPTGSLPRFRDIFFGWGRRFRRARRYVTILAIFMRHGLLSRLRRDPEEDADSSRTAVAFREALDDCGITFIKLGQMLSTRADIMPAPFVRELAKLQTTAEPEPWEDISVSLEESLGCPLTEAFASINEVPLASASGAQVHVATLKNGKDVVVKVQRPGAAGKAQVDLDILRRLSRTLEANAPWAQRMGLAEITEGFARSLEEELDYRDEADNMRAMKASMDKRGVRIPITDEKLSGAKCIVMERFDGKPVGKAQEIVAGLSEQQRHDAASTLLDAVLAQIIQDGIFHSDLHPGNVFIWPDGSVGLLDFGSVGRIDAVSRRSLATLLWAIDADDPVLATDSLLELVDAPSDLDERSLRRSIGMLMTRFRGGLGAGGSLDVFTELFELVLDHGFAIPSSVATALRSLGALEGTLKLIDPDLDLVDAARAAGRDTIGSITPEKIKKELTAKAMHMVPLLEHLPHRINKITEDLENGTFTAHFRVMSHPEDRAFVNSMIQQVVLAVLAGAAVLGGILLITTPGGPLILPNLSLWTLLGGLLSFGGFVLALRSIAQVFGTSKYDL